MEQRRKRWPVALGLALCVLTLGFAVVMQASGYLTYLDSDMASEMILARRQVDTGSLVQMDWLYSTEIHILHLNVLYALAFLFTPSFFLARIIGNTLGLILGMAACVYLCRKLHLSWGRALGAAALLPACAGNLYAYSMIVGGYYIIHLLFAFLGAALWLHTGEIRGRRRVLPGVLAFAGFCMISGFLSVRYVLCFICPMAATAGMELLLAPEQSRSLRDHTMRFGAVTAAGFAACLLGYAASEVIVPRLFESGVGAAGSFTFNPLSAQAMAAMMLTVGEDFLKLLGWRGGVPLFSGEGIVNLCILCVLFLGGVMTHRVMRSLDEHERGQRMHKRMMRYALWAVAVNIVCFVWIEGAYLNRYLVVAVVFLTPMLAVVLRREKNMRLKVVFLLALCVHLGLSGALLLQDTRAQEIQAQARGEDMMDAAEALLEKGYTHGYGTFWNVRVMQERTQGALTFTGVVPVEAEEGAVCSVSLDPIRWLEPDEASDLDACPGRTFLLLTREEEEQLAPWLEMTGAPRIYENDSYVVCGFASSEQFVACTLWGKMKLEHAQYEDGLYTLRRGGRMRVPTSWREAGKYALRLTCEGEPAADSVMQIYATSGFELLCEKPLVQGENAMEFTLEHDDKYLMILIKGGEAEQLRIGNLALNKE